MKTREGHRLCLEKKAIAVYLHGDLTGDTATWHQAVWWDDALVGFDLDILQRNSQDMGHPLSYLERMDQFQRIPYQFIIYTIM